MGYVRVKDTEYGGARINIVAIPDHYVNLPAQISVSHAVDAGDGRKVIKGGLCLVDANDSLKRASGVTPVKLSGEEVEKFTGVVFGDVEVPYGVTDFVTVPVLLHGFVKEAALVKVGDVIPKSGTDMILSVR